MKENSIEEDIEILEKFKNNEMQRDKLERDGRCGGWKIGDIYKCLELDNAIDNILSDYKRVLKENEELKALDLSNSKMIANMSTRHFHDREKIRNSIPKQKIKDKIEELEKDEYSKYYDMFLEERDLKYTIQILQELLEESEE